ncbi:MAG: acetylglutamate kinase [Gemmatimonadaceae bacterium]
MTTEVTTEPMKRVVKLGGRAQSADGLPALVADAWARSSGSVCVVHGGGDEISALQRVLGGEPKFAGGRRITTAADLDIIRMVLSGAVNKRLVARLGAAGVPAVGISGEDASLIVAQPLGIAEFGYVGMPSRINTALIESLWLAGFLPVISPLGSSAATPGSALNVNGDDAAAAIAVALGADELLLIADVEGVLDSAGFLMPQIDVDGARALIASGVAEGGMAAKLEAAHAALAGGVRTVRIANMSALEDAECGTFITLAMAGAR